MNMINAYDVKEERYIIINLDHVETIRAFSPEKGSAANLLVMRSGERKLVRFNWNEFDELSRGDRGLAKQDAWKDVDQRLPNEGDNVILLLESPLGKYAFRGTRKADKWFMTPFPGAKITEDSEWKVKKWIEIPEE